MRMVPRSLNAASASAETTIPAEAGADTDERGGGGMPGAGAEGGEDDALRVVLLSSDFSSLPCLIATHRQDEALDDETLRGQQRKDPRYMQLDAALFAAAGQCAGDVLGPIGCGDFDGTHTVVLKRSTDRGRTWSDIQTIMDPASILGATACPRVAHAGCEFWDPTAVYDASTSEVHLLAALSTTQSGRCLLYTSPSPRDRG